ncbi:MAG: type I restriction-modification enzyme R subunit C-terminal domain-containing protein [Candidatus Competibacteraceae bacterium]
MLRAEWHGDTTKNAKALKQDFEHYLQDHRDEIEALTIFYSQPARRSELTFAMIKSVLEKLKQDQVPSSPHCASGKLMRI